MGSLADLGAVVPVLCRIVKVIVDMGKLGPTLAVDPDVGIGIMPILSVEHHVEPVDGADRAVFQERVEPSDGDAVLLGGRDLGGSDHVGEHRHALHEVIHGAHLVGDLLQCFLGCLLEEKFPSADIVGDRQNDQDGARTRADGDGETLADRAGDQKIFQKGHAFSRGIVHPGGPAKRRDECPGLTGKALCLFILQRLCKSNSNRPARSLL